MKLWFNQAFSLRNIVSRIAVERPGISLCVSAIDPESPVRDVAPEFWREPARGTFDYPEWLLATAIERGVDALVAQRGRMDVAGMADRFAAEGIALHVAADAATLRLLDDKAAFSAALAGDAMLCPTIPVTTAAAFEAAVDAIARGGAVACVKPATGIYGAGYWTLDAATALQHLADPDARRIAPEVYAAALRAGEARGETFSLLVMEHLPGLEASVDIVADRGDTLVAAVRTKLDANRQRIETRHPLIAHAVGLVARYALHGAVNVQYRQDREGAWRILEINTRAAGGASYCDAVGVPFSATWVDVVTGAARRFDADVNVEIVAVVHAERRRRTDAARG
ncbi:ATP-grasp domain-containing protein [Sphingomonas sp. NFR15]|uniref:ATP-grasp domain-containing protein n=1 Tax=Sphingomonas sp. NFR15 TaxID=1566282 RepID=UPI000886DA55|nr:ATP-grasp domain-containing protein [Sphingomonas sp. NFR15]SDA14275.1 ATP-grasp domain-containing protein [Sphingomonas sp. NFR15]